MPETRFTKDHEWVRLDGDIATIGITPFAAEALGDIVFVEHPEIGRMVTTGEACAVVESVKAASDIYAPVSGTVTEVNNALADEPGTINAEPQGKGWFFKLKISNKDELAQMMDEQAYTSYLATL